ncbi:MAG: allose kinase [Clostridiales bacterium]|jgi:allose kinase|nr:allose kinase [Clostridiales bacterium]
MGVKEVLGIDIGGTYIRAGMVAGFNRLNHFAMDSSAALFYGGGSPIGALADYILRYVEKNLGGDKPAAVSLGFPSAVSKDKTTLYSTPNLPGLNDLDVVAPLKEILGIPVFMDRDVNHLLLFDTGENAIHTDSGIIIGYYVGTGLGNAIMIDGKLLTGKNGVAAELGHVSVKGREAICGCGKAGCYETIVSGRYLEKLASEQYPGESVRDIFVRHRDDAVLMDYVDWLAIPLAAEINIFDPDYVILGGGVLQMKGFPTEKLTESVHAYTRKPEPDGSLKIIFSSGKQESGVVGAGISGINKMK